MKKVIFISIVGILILASGGMSYGYDWMDDLYSNPYGDQYPMGDIPETPPQPELPLGWPTPPFGIPSNPDPGDCPEPNNPPVAVDDAASTPCNTSVTISVLANDSDPDGDTLSLYGIVQGYGPSNGTAGKSGSKVVYTPNPGFEGTDTFKYKVIDGNGGYDKAYVTITVTCEPPPNNCPVAVNDSAAATCGAPVTINVLANDSDPDGDTLSIVGITQGPSNGSATISGSQVKYTPDSGFDGTDYIKYKISDGSCCDVTACVTITVTCQPPPNNCPVAVNDSAAATCGESININVLANDSDPDGDTLSIVGITQGPSHGTAVVSDSQVVYTPHSGFDGTDYIKYEISDNNGCSDIACVTITVTCEPPPTSDCQQCGPGYGGSGKTYYIEVTRDDDVTADAMAKWDSKKGKWDKLESNTILVFSDGSWAKVHTSCSQPLYIGLEVPVYRGSTKKPGNPVGYATVTDLITTPCVPDPPSGGNDCSWCH